MITARSKVTLFGKRIEKLHKTFLPPAAFAGGVVWAIPHHSGVRRCLYSISMKIG
jgi:hypothetical protein